MKTRLYTNRSGLKHDTGAGHPEQAARLSAIYSLFEEPPFSDLMLVEAEPADEEWILRAHADSYFYAVADAAPDSGTHRLDEDTVMSPGTWRAALDAAGAACLAVGDVCGGACARAFCAIRPPGHHALPTQAMGFCIFNNAFIAARHAQEVWGVKKVAIVDFDVHHGNGTDYMARRAENILFISSHQFPFWPGTGDPQYDEPGKTLNVPLPAGAGSALFRAEYESKVFPALEKFAPELLLISAGFDAHRDDPLGGLDLTEEDFAWVTRKLCEIADRHAKGRVISLLEGGYNLDALRASAAAHLRALAGV
jgi:acetoin utilization deacetylase AcuC-like enzyme